MPTRARRAAAKTSHPRSSEPAVEAVVESHVDAERLRELIPELPVAGMLRLDAPMPQKTTFVVTSQTWRIDLGKDSVYGARMSLVRHRDGRAVWLDHGSKSRLELPRGSVPDARVGRPGRWRVTEPDAVTQESRPGQLEVELEDPGSGTQWVQRIRCGPPYDQPELARRFFEALVGGSAIHDTTGYPIEQVADMVARAGFPAEVDVATGPKSEPVATYRIRRIRIRPATDADRGAEPNYLDLRSRKAPERWSKPGPGRAEFEARELDDLRPPEVPIALPMIRRDDDGRPDGADRERPEPEPHERPPSTLPPTLTTSSAQVALRIEQRLLDDVLRTVNALAAHVVGATTSGTDLVIPWLEQVVEDARALDPNRTKTVPGTGLAAILHEDTGAPTAPTPVKSVVGGGGRGVLDRMAVSRTSALLAAGTIPPVSLSATDIAAITTAIATAAPAARLAALPAAVRSRLLAAVLFDDIGSLKLSLAELRKPINVSDLYFIQLTDFKFSVSLPPVPAPPTTGPAPPRGAPLVTRLRCRAGGSIEGSVTIDRLGVDATLVRTPTTTWAILVAASPLIPLVMPAFAWVVPFLWAIAIFLATDFARMRLDAKPLRVSVAVQFLPSPGSPALRPVVTARLSGSIRTRMLSYVPTGIHQVIDWTLAEIANFFAVTMSLLEGQIAGQLQTALTKLMGNGVPGSLLQLGVPVVSGQAAGEDDKYVYLESTLGTPSDPRTRITPVPVSAALRWDLDRDITRVFGASGNNGRGRHYLSLGASINAINQVAAVLWRRGAFDQFVSSGNAAFLRPLLAPPFSGTVTRIDVSHGAAPMLSHPGGNPTDPKRFFDVVFPAFVVSVNRNSSTRWFFRFRIDGRGAFGLGSVPSGRRFLALPGIQPPIYELFLDLGSLTATLLEATEAEEATITVRESGNDPRRPQKITTHLERIETLTDHTASAPSQWLSYALGIFRLAYGWRDVNVVPRLDGLGGRGAWPLDGPAQQTYTFTGDDPDASTATGPGPLEPYASAPVDWGFLQGLTFTHVQLDGAPRQILSGNPHLNTLMTVDGELIWPFLNGLFP